MSSTNFIEINPEICFGKPHIKGTRLKVSFILDLFSSGWTMDEILREYSQLTKEKVQACLDYASKIIDSNKLLEVANEA